MLGKNDYCEVDITDIGHNGEGIGKYNDFVLFVDNALPGDFCGVKILKMKKAYGYAKIERIIQKSPNRAEPACHAFDKCGGCSLMHFNYDSQLIFKGHKISESLKRIGNIENPVVYPVIPSARLCGYRNKSQIPVREENGEVKIGYYMKNSHRIVENTSCFISNGITGKITSVIKEYMRLNNIKAYNEKSGSGTVRHILIRNDIYDKEVMVCIIINRHFGFMLKNIELLIELLSHIGGVKSISLNYNTRRDNVIMGEKCKTVWGKDYITDYMDGFKFRISPQSFYQVNAGQANKIYKKAAEFAKLSKNDDVIDAYSGIGTMSSFLAKNAGKVYGIEIVQEAINDAIYNACINKLNNVEFICGKSEEIIFSLIEKGVRPAAVVLDPPRKGCGAPIFKAIEKAGPERVIYVSCNPDTLARDAKALAECGYSLVKLQPYDMFAYTVHVESVALFEKKAV